jgi:hypothetical protein
LQAKLAEINEMEPENQSDNDEDNEEVNEDDDEEEEDEDIHDETDWEEVKISPLGSSSSRQGTTREQNTLPKFKGATPGPVKEYIEGGNVDGIHCQRPLDFFRIFFHSVVMNTFIGKGAISADVTTQTNLKSGTSRSLL